MSLSFSEPASCTRSGWRQSAVTCATLLQMETCISRGFRMSIQERSASVSRDSENALPLVGSLPGRQDTPGKLSHPRQPFIVLQALHSQVFPRQSMSTSHLRQPFIVLQALHSQVFPRQSMSTSHPRQPFIVLQAPKHAAEGRSSSATEIEGWLLGHSQAYQLTGKGDLPARRKWRPSGTPRPRVHLVEACSSQTEMLRDPKSSPHKRFRPDGSKAVADCLFYRISPEAIVGLVSCNWPQ
jgi:hypothetical protein